MTNNLLKHYRIQRAYSQKNVADQLGVHVTTVSRWEQGHSQPTPYALRQLCVLFRKQPLDLFPSLVPPLPLEPSPTADVTIETSHYPNNLKRERLRRMMTQEQLAQKIGVSRVSISRWEQGHILPNRHAVQALSHCFKKRARDLFPALTAPSQPHTSVPLTLPESNPSPAPRQHDEERTDGNLTSLTAFTSAPVGTSTLQEAAQLLALEQHRLLVLQEGLALQQRSLHHTIAIACQIIKQIVPGIDEASALALASKLAAGTMSVPAPGVTVSQTTPGDVS